MAVAAGIIRGKINLSSFCNAHLILMRSKEFFLEKYILMKASAIVYHCRQETKSSCKRKSYLITVAMTGQEEFKRFRLKGKFSYQIIYLKH